MKSPFWKSIQAPTYWLQIEKHGKWSRKRNFKRHANFKREVMKAIRAGFHWTGGTR